MAVPGADISALKPEIYSRDEHPISRKDIDPDALKIMYRLIRSGFKAYMVGGGVRDLLLGKKPKDFDITTDATPRRVKALFSNSRIIGRRFKLVHVFFGGGKIIEVSTFRDFSDPPEGGEGEEGEVAQLAPDNKYGTEVTDAIRRDITINGLFYDLSTLSVIDYVGGIRDLSDRVIRVIGNPDVRFSEDPVRMIRVVRHAARTGFSIDKLSWDSIARLHGMISNCPPMRVFEELKKDLQSGHFLKIMRLLAQTQLLDEFLPDLLHDYPALFSDDTAAGKLLGEIDERFRINKGPSVSVVLTVLALLSMPGAKSFVDPEMAPFQGSEELTEYFNGCFRRLAVPRRERERVESLLIGWLYLLTNGAEPVRASRVIEPELIDDLIVLLEILEMNPELIESLEGKGPLADSNQHGTRRGSRRRRRRRRGGGGRRGAESEQAVE